jgi:hypothetical protein
MPSEKWLTDSASDQEFLAQMRAAWRTGQANMLRQFVAHLASWGLMTHAPDVAQLDPAIELFLDQFHHKEETGEK